MIKVVIQTPQGTYIVDKDVLWVDVYDGENADELIKRYGYTKDKQESVPIPNPIKKPETYESAAAKRIKLTPIEAWLEACWERYRLFWKNFLRD